jgi:hypothetical protein
MSITEHTTSSSSTLKNINDELRELYENNAELIDFIILAIKNNCYNVKIMENIGYRIIDNEGNISDNIYSYEGISYTKETFKAEIENYKTELINSGTNIIGDDLSDDDLSVIFGDNTNMSIISMFNSITEVINNEEHYIYNMIYKLYNFEYDYITVFSPTYYFNKFIKPFNLLSTFNEFVKYLYTNLLYYIVLKN